MFASCYPKHLQRLSVFEDFNDDYATVYHKDCCELERGYTVQLEHRDLAQAFARRSIDLEYLSVSFMIDAWDFFNACHPEWRWPNLETLVLTSQRLTIAADEEQVNTLLYLAAKAALWMPNLRGMVLWNVKESGPCAFKYVKQDGVSQITWHSTWGFDFQAPVILAWADVADLPSRAIRFWGQGLVRGRIPQVKAFSCHGEAIAWLQLPAGVIDPISLWQIRMEALPKL